MTNSTAYYTRTAQFLHWVMAIIFIIAWLIGFYSSNFLDYAIDGSFKADAITLHKSIASTIIFLVIIRIFWRYTHPAPQLPETMSPAMKTLAHIGHLVLYFILVALPITGSLYSWSAGYPVPVLYLFNIPQLIHINPDMMPVFKSIHVYLSWFAGLLVLGHIGAALKHHFIDKDHVLISMLKRPKA